MSLITDDPGESPRDCATKHHHRRGRRRRVVIAVSSATASLVSLSIILWLTLRPSSPTFSLLAATVVSSNATTTLIVDAAFVAHNPNARAAALYDRLQLHVQAAGIQLAAASPILPFQQSQGDVVISAQAAAAAPAIEGTTAPLLLRLRVEGQLRWKVAAWVSASHVITADCVAVVPLRTVVAQGSQCATTLS